MLGSCLLSFSPNHELVESQSSTPHVCFDLGLLWLSDAPCAHSLHGMSEIQAVCFSLRSYSCKMGINSDSCITPAMSEPAGSTAVIR